MITKYTYILPFVLYFVFLHYVQSQSINNNIFMRLYVKKSNSKFRKLYIAPIVASISQTKDNINLFLLNTNTEYSKLSEEDKFIIETILGFMF